MVEAWNADHPDEQIKAQEIPAGASSEESITAAITAGNAPCLDLQHLARGRARIPEAGRPRQPLGVRGRRRLHHGAHRRPRRPVPLRGRRLLPAAVEVEPRHDLLQQGHVPAGGPRPREPGAVDVRRVPRHVAHPRRGRRGGVRDQPVSDQRVLPAVVRLLPALRGADAAARCSSRTARPPSTTRTAQPSRTSGAPSTTRSSPATSSTRATPSPTASPPWRSSDRGPSRCTATP